MEIPRQRIGTCRSGKLIYTFTTDDWNVITHQCVNYGPEDHFDAWVVFERLTVREIRLQGETSAECSRLLRYAKFHEESISNEFIQAERLRLGLATSPDLVRFAAKLTEDVFLD